MGDQVHLTSDLRAEAATLPAGRAMQVMPSWPVFKYRQPGSRASLTMANPRHPVAPEPTRWTIHGERLVDDTRRLRLSIVQVELPDGVHFEQYAVRMPKAAMTVLLDDARERVLMDLAAPVRAGALAWELPGGYVDTDEDPAVTAARGRGGNRLASPQHDAADPVSAHVGWSTLDSVRDRITQGEIIGAGTQIGLLHVLTFHAPPAR